MTSYTGTWDRPGVSSFLEEVTVPLRLGCHTPSGEQWIVPLWYRFRNGSFECATGADADVVSFLEADPNVAFDVSTNEMPYRGVRGRGEATVSPDSDKAVLRDLLERYLGGLEQPPGPSLLRSSREEVRITVDPDRIHSWDFSDRMASSD